MMPMVLSYQTVDVLQALTLMVVGMLVVFTGLVVLQWTIELINRLLPHHAPPAPAQPVTAVQPEPILAIETATGGSLEMDPQLIAILAAAAIAVVQRPVQIQRVQFLERTAEGGAAWTQLGRRTIMTSHRPHR
jgi:Na+-transporting methylmalonyl-CoA/oxaloacetate decarboxylase gamma subunit